MRLNLFVAAIFAATSLSLSGCAMFEAAQETSRQSFRALRAKSSDYRDWNEDEEDEFAYVGEIARGHEPPEKQSDQWYRRWFMSAQARNIEKNLGVE